ncbi:UDP-N-acetylmuramoyl-L-alanine--D-glutamate ligase [Facklamia lactis]|nr:UDP-N-acetylmuramoyl-L-alanine--D-glutamate ligase [Facklamia lactis]
MTNRYQNQNVLVLGYALTGKSVVDYLLRENANITLNDRGDLSQDPSVDLLLKAGVKVVDGGHPIELLEGIDMVVKSPVIPYSIEIIQEAIHQKIPVYTDVELAYLHSQAPIIGITGSNGKTTTTSLIQEILNKGIEGQAFLAGNIGIPSLEVAQMASENDRIVMELSSFQLMGIENFRPKIAVFTNIYSAHLDFHGSREEYVRAKLQLIKNLTAEDYLVYNADQEELVELLADSPAIKCPFSRKEYLEKGACLANQGLYYDGERILEQSSIAMPGDHNIENVLAAMAVAKIEGVANDDIEQVVSQYHGMPHRIQYFATYQGVKYYNDSKATNTTATITALKSFEQDLIYIGGGLDRGNDFKDLIPYLKTVKAAYLYGESKEKMAHDFQAAGVPRIETVENLAEASRRAIEMSQPGQVVLFSPACASWDQYQNYEVRGQEFMDQVHDYCRGLE